MPSSFCLPGGQPRRQCGFTLIELMIVVVIIGIIASVAYPSYTRYVERSIRTDAHAGLAQAASELERCYTRTYSYTDDSCEVTDESPEEYYNLNVTHETDGDDGGYTVTAKLKNDSRSDGCSSDITLNAKGDREPEDCW
ncbi:type IV pilin protein [Vreelandella massiliensis]|uniref:type IV pilin protein n=1 Tax=Vreelandella massiliensis TaxID=1816686 RepID=UPI00096A78BB|nr:type IV pilin protein [Halomonas massiliensis]